MRSGFDTRDVGGGGIDCEDVGTEVDFADVAAGGADAMLVRSDGQRPRSRNRAKTTCAPTAPQVIPTQIKKRLHTSQPPKVSAISESNTQGGSRNIHHTEPDPSSPHTPTSVLAGSFSLS